MSIHHFKQYVMLIYQIKSNQIKSNQCIMSIYNDVIFSTGCKLMEIWSSISKNIEWYFFCMSTSLLGFRDFDGLQWLQIVKRYASHANQKGPIRILDSFTTGVPARSGSEAEALAFTLLPRLWLRRCKSTGCWPICGCTAMMSECKEPRRMRLQATHLRWPGLRCFKHAVTCPSNVMQKLRGTGFSTNGKQSGCRWLESGHDMLHTVVKFGSCNELTADHIHHLKTNLQCKTVWCLKRLCGWFVAGWYFERKPTMQKSVWGIDAPSGQRLCVAMKVLAMHVLQTQDPWVCVHFSAFSWGLVEDKFCWKINCCGKFILFGSLWAWSNFPDIQKQLHNYSILIWKDLSSIRSFL